MLAALYQVWPQDSATAVDLGCPRDLEPVSLFLIQAVRLLISTKFGCFTIDDSKKPFCSEGCSLLSRCHEESYVEQFKHVSPSRGLARASSWSTAADNSPVPLGFL